MRARCIPLSQVPSRPGTYVLITQLASPTEVDVGKLGMFHLPAGWYAYVGSALGPGGLAGRLGRHRLQHKRLHWHIDYLLNVSQLTEIWWAASVQRYECALVEVLSLLAGTTMPVPGFGSSDCGCPAHLFYSDRHLPFSALASRLAGRCTLFLTVLDNPI
jgi:Uri superfamily endonuclease